MNFNKEDVYPQKRTNRDVVWSDVWVEMTLDMEQLVPYIAAVS